MVPKESIRELSSESTRVARVAAREGRKIEVSSCSEVTKESMNSQDDSVLSMLSCPSISIQDVC